MDLFQWMDFGFLVFRYEWCTLGLTLHDKQNKGLNICGNGPTTVLDAYNLQRHCFHKHAKSF